MDVLIEKDIPIAAGVAAEVFPRIVARLTEESHVGGIRLAAAAHGQQGELARIEVTVVVDSNAATHRHGEPLTLDVRSRSASVLFPVFSGTISLSAAEAALTRVVLSGSYTVPLGVFGAAINAIVLDRVAREGLRSLLAIIVERVGRDVADRADADYRASRQN